MQFVEIWTQRLINVEERKRYASEEKRENPSVNDINKDKNLLFFDKKIKIKNIKKEKINITRTYDGRVTRVANKKKHVPKIVHEHASCSRSLAPRTGCKKRETRRL